MSITVPRPARTADRPAPGNVAPAEPRVLHVGKYYPPTPGGMERVLQLLCEHVEGVQHEVLVAGTGPRTTRGRWNGVPVTRAARFGAIGSVGVCPTLPWELARISRDLTVIHEPNPLALVADLLAGQHGPLVVWYHSEVLRPAWKFRLLYKPFLARVLERAARIVVSSPNLAAHAAELQPYASKCRVIPFGVSLARFDRTPDIEAGAAVFRHRYGRPIVLFVGRLVPYKGVSVLLDAVRGLDVQTVIVGTGPLAEALAAQVDRTSLAERVSFLGELSDRDLLGLYHACDLLVLPSVTRAEAFGMVQLEAMACGKPVVSTDLPSGVPWVNRHDETGVIVPPGVPGALRAAIESLLGDPGRRRRLGAGARARVACEFTVERMARRTLSLYRDVLSGTT